MNRRILSVIALSCMALTSAWAHHSFAAAYDMQNPITVKGTIDYVRLQNPHSWFVLNVKDATGKVEQWAFEARKRNHGWFGSDGTDDESNPRWL